MITHADGRPLRAAPTRDRLRARLIGGVALCGAAAVALRFSAELGLICVFSVAATWALVPVMRRIAARIGATVLPGGRSIHSEPTALLGGVAIYLPFAAFLAASGGRQEIGLALGCGVMVLAGAWDDVKGLSPRWKIFAQVVGALILVGSGTSVPAIGVAPLGTIPLPGLELVAVVFWVVLVTNAVNLIDGMDGLAATLALVGAAACALLGLMPAAAIVLAGTCLGFLRHNLPRAKIFLGDAGSLMLGFTLAAFLLNGAGAVNLPVALGVLAVPLGDVAVSATRRWLRGKPIFSGDCRHVHHRLLSIWQRPAFVVVGLAALAGAQAAAVTRWPDLFGLIVVAALWVLALAYLVAKVRPGWARILLHRKTFRRIHVVRQYAHESLRLAESSADVASVMERVAVDLGLISLRLRTVRVERPRPEGVVEVEEHVDCGRDTASWSAPFVAGDTVLAEEKRTILCDLLRLADARLDALDPAPSATPARAPRPAPAPSVASGRPVVHFIADSRERLRRIVPFVRETRRRGSLDALVVYTGRRDDLGLTDAQFRELDLARPDLELDVPRGPNIVQTARIMERYHALLETRRPSVVVVGDSSACVACALVAKEQGLPVAQIGSHTVGEPAAPTPPLNRALTESIADLVLSPRRAAATPGEQLLFGSAAQGSEADAADLVPALEALLVTSAAPA